MHRDVAHVVGPYHERLSVTGASEVIVASAFHDNWNTSFAADMHNSGNIPGRFRHDRPSAAPGLEGVEPSRGVKRPRFVFNCERVG